jgi:hypothetical protein
MVTLIWEELYEPEVNNYELHFGKTELNPDRGRVGVIYGRKLPWQERLEIVLMGDTHLSHIRTGS